LANNQNFIVKHGLTVGGVQQVIDTSGNWVGPDTPYANASFARANSKTRTYTQDTPPTGVNDNDIWVDSSNGVQYVYITDVNSSQWVELGAFAPLSNITANIAFVNQTLTGVYSNRDVVIVQTGSGNIWLNSSNTVVGNLIPFTGFTTIGTEQYPFNQIHLLSGSIYMAGNGASSPVIIDNDANNVVIRSGGLKVFDGDLQANAGFRTAYMYNANLTGRLILSNSTFNSSQSAFTITGSSTGTIISPANPGYMVHITGLDGVPSRIINDSFGTGAYGVFASRSARGTSLTPQALQTGDVIARYSGSGHDGTSFPALGCGRIDIVATENHTSLNKGTEVQIWSTNNQSNTLTQIASFSGNTANFTGTIVTTGGFAYTPRFDTSNNTTQNISFTTDAFVRINVDDNTTIVPNGFLAGKVIDVFLTNFAVSTKTITHGLYANNSTIGATTKQMASGSTMYLKYISYDGDLANTYVAITYN
jgi:hypothetical protein